MQPVAVTPESGDPLRLVLPGGIVPVNGRHDTWWEDAWNRHVWNDSYLDCSPKPTWKMIVDAANKALTRSSRQRVLRGLRLECERRISLAYGEDDARAETFFRLRASAPAATAADKAALAAGDAERDRLSARYRAIKSWVEGLDLSALDSIVDPADAEFWAATWRPPE